MGGLERQRQSGGKKKKGVGAPMPMLAHKQRTPHIGLSQRPACKNWQRISRIPQKTLMRLDSRVQPLE